MKSFLVTYRHKGIRGTARVAGETERQAMTRFKHEHPGAFIENIRRL